MALTVTCWSSSDVGRVRSHNEDRYLVDDDLGLYAVADGMGGHARGEVASALACDVLREHVLRRKDVIEHFKTSPSPESAADVETVLQEAFIRACAEIYEASATLASSGRMGTTLDAVLLLNDTAFTAHVGDGRIYMVRGGEAHQITEDHSLIQEQIKAGVITEDEARRSRHRNVITRALGAFPSVLVDLLQVDLAAGDRMVLCSDGLHGYVAGEELVKLLRVPGPESADDLVNLANHRGGKDNITAVVLGADRPEAASDELRIAPSEHIEALRKCELFAVCTYRELVQIASIAETRTYKRGTMIFRQEDRGREVFIIEHGGVEILRDGHALAQLGEADFFGELSFLDSPRRSASALVTHDTRVLVLSGREFLALLQGEATLANKLLWRLLIRLSQLLRSTNARVLEQMASIDTHDLELLEIDLDG